MLIANARLKVQLESDYLAQDASLRSDAVILRPPEGRAEGSLNDSQELSRQILREVIIPVLEKEVNEGKNFARVRQIFHSLILANWYRDALKESLLGKVYANAGKTNGLEIADPLKEKQAIYEQYVETFRRGVFNYIKEETDPATGETIPRKYISGGVSGNFAMSVTHDPKRVEPANGRISTISYALQDAGIKPGKIQLGRHGQYPPKGRLRPTDAALQESIETVSWEKGVNAAQMIHKLTVKAAKEEYSFRMKVNVKKEGGSDETTWGKIPVSFGKLTLDSKQKKLLDLLFSEGSQTDPDPEYYFIPLKNGGFVIKSYAVESINYDSLPLPYYDETSDHTAQAQDKNGRLYEIARSVSLPKVSNEEDRLGLGNVIKNLQMAGLSQTLTQFLTFDADRKGISFVRKNVREAGRFENLRQCGLTASSILFKGSLRVFFIIADPAMITAETSTTLAGVVNTPEDVLSVFTVGAFDRGRINYELARQALSRALTDTKSAPDKRAAILKEVLNQLALMTQRTDNLYSEEPLFNEFWAVLREVIPELVNESKTGTFMLWDLFRLTGLRTIPLDALGIPRDAAFRLRGLGLRSAWDVLDAYWKDPSRLEAALPEGPARNVVEYFSIHYILDVARTGQATAYSYSLADIMRILKEQAFQWRSNVNGTPQTSEFQDTTSTAISVLSIRPLTGTGVDGYPLTSDPGGHLEHQDSLQGLIAERLGNLSGRRFTLTIDGINGHRSAIFTEIAADPAQTNDPARYLQESLAAMQSARAQAPASFEPLMATALSEADREINSDLKNTTGDPLPAKAFLRGYLLYWGLITLENATPAGLLARRAIEHGVGTETSAYGESVARDVVFQLNDELVKKNGTKSLTPQNKSPMTNAAMLRTAGSEPVVTQGGIDFGNGQFLKVIDRGADNVPVFDPAQLEMLRQDLNGLVPVPIGAPRPVSMNVLLGLTDTTASPNAATLSFIPAQGAVITREEALTA